MGLLTVQTIKNLNLKIQDRPISQCACATTTANAHCGWSKYEPSKSRMANGRHFGKQLNCNTYAIVLRILMKFGTMTCFSVPNSSALYQLSHVNNRIVKRIRTTILGYTHLPNKHCEMVLRIVSVHHFMMRISFIASIAV